jgi:hypothetical protein
MLGVELGVSGVMGWIAPGIGIGDDFGGDVAMADEVTEAALAKECANSNFGGGMGVSSHERDDPSLFSCDAGVLYRGLLSILLLWISPLSRARLRLSRPSLEPDEASDMKGADVA